MEQILTVLAGQPNCGKSTIFNMLTGARQYVANYPGVTVEKKAGSFVCGDTRVELVDLPGTYSLASWSPEEMAARQFIVEEDPAQIVAVLDASTLEKSLYLCLQLLEMRRPTLAVLNMMDVAAKRGIRVDADALSQALGIPVIRAQASKGIGKQELYCTEMRKTRGNRRDKRGRGWTLWDGFVQWHYTKQGVEVREFFPPERKKEGPWWPLFFIVYGSGCLVGGCVELERLPRSKHDTTPRRDVDGFPGLGIASGAGCVIRDAERSPAGEDDAAALFHFIAQDLQQSIEVELRPDVGVAGTLGHSPGEFLLVHGVLLVRCGLPHRALGFAAVLWGPSCSAWGRPQTPGPAPILALCHRFGRRRNAGTHSHPHKSLSDFPVRLRSRFRASVSP